MAGTDLVSAHPVRAQQSLFSYSRVQRPIVAWRTGSDLELWEPAVAGICSESDVGCDRATAVPEGCNAIRREFDEDEPPAVVFSDQALPGALVSWAWCQLTALDALLAGIIEKRSRQDGESDLAGAVHTVLVPVINALEFSERRAAELQHGQAVRRVKRHKSASARKNKNTRT